MIVSADLPEELAAKVDALVHDPKPPAWPFPSKTIRADVLMPAERKLLTQYQVELAAYEIAMRAPDQPRSRSAVVKMILSEYFARNGNGKKS